MKHPEKFTCCDCGRERPWEEAWSHVRDVLANTPIWDKKEIWCDDCEDRRNREPRKRRRRK